MHRSPTRESQSSVMWAILLLILSVLVCLTGAGCATFSLPKQPTPLQRVDALEQDYLDLVDALTELRAMGFVGDSDWKKIETIDKAVSAAFASVKQTIEDKKPVDVAALRRAVIAGAEQLLPFLNHAQRARAMAPPDKL